MGATKRLVLADDHAVLRAGLRSFFEDQANPPMQVVAEAETAEEALEAIQRTLPDLVVLDLSMPGLGGIGGLLELRRLGLTVPVLVLTQYPEPAMVRRALEAGANGYVLKTARGEALLTAIRAVLAGGTYVDPTVAGALLPGRDLFGRAGSGPSSDEEALQRLTARERQVLTLIAEGYSNKEVATALDIAVKTAMAHRANLMDKLDIHNHSKLVHFALRVGLTQLK
ncbi:MAG: response regulator transcription factor [Myxococcales bacterium]|nr:response regulator transcription factor [Myxococcales bacterium]MCB9525846.1 response regulator transcription factor [Myxococcales bacterium]